MARLLGDKPVRMYSCRYAWALGYHASPPFDGSLPSGHDMCASKARTFFLVETSEQLHPLVAAPLPEAPSVDDTAIGRAGWPVASISLPPGPGMTPATIKVYLFLSEMVSE